MKYHLKINTIEAEPWEPGKNDQIVESRGMINHGDRETEVAIHTKGRFTVPAGHGLMINRAGPVIVKPGDFVFTDEQGQHRALKPFDFLNIYAPEGDLCPS